MIDGIGNCLHESSKKPATLFGRKHFQGVNTYTTLQLYRYYFISHSKDPYSPTRLSWNVTGAFRSLLMCFSLGAYSQLYNIHSLKFSIATETSHFLEITFTNHIKPIIFSVHALNLGLVPMCFSWCRDGTRRNEDGRLGRKVSKRDVLVTTTRTTGACRWKGGPIGYSSSHNHGSGKSGPGIWL